jgi:hypothetical protein
MPYTLDTAIALPDAGLALSAQLVNTTGANVGSAVTTGFTDLGLGFYLWHYSSYPDGHRGAVKFSAGGVLRAVAAINPEEAENTDTKTSTRATSTASAPPAVTIVSPVVQGGNVQIVRGDDYANADGRALTFDISDPTGTGLPSLTGATVRLKTGLPNRPNLAVLNVTGTVVTATGTTRTVRFELTSAQTAVLVPIAYNFDVEATLSTGRVITLLQGQCIVLADA